MCRPYQANSSDKRLPYLTVLDVVALFFIIEAINAVLRGLGFFLPAEHQTNIVLL